NNNNNNNNNNTDANSNGKESDKKEDVKTPKETETEVEDIVSEEKLESNPPNDITRETSDPASQMLPPDTKQAELASYSSSQQLMTLESQEKETDVSGAFDHPPGAVDKESLPIILDEQDRRALWSGFDPNYPLHDKPSWEIPRAIDPLPLPEEYQRYQEGQKQLQQFQKDHKDEPLPQHLREIFLRKPMTQFPRKVLKALVFSRLLNDRGGEYGDCPHEESVSGIILYWCYNNSRFTQLILDWCFHNLCDEFNTERNDFMLWLLLIEKVLQQRDKNFETTWRAWVPRMTQLLTSSASSKASGADLLTYQLLAWFQRLSLRVPEIMTDVLQSVKLREISEKFDFFFFGYSRYDKEHPEVLLQAQNAASSSRLSRTTKNEATKNEATKNEATKDEAAKDSNDAQTHAFYICLFKCLPLYVDIDLHFNEQKATIIWTINAPKPSTFQSALQFKRSNLFNENLLIFFFEIMLQQ
ncbi:hypothetical protein RFI_10008, partial [Reticulomyxa filosa]